MNVPNSDPQTKFQTETPARPVSSSRPSIATADFADAPPNSQPSTCRADLSRNSLSLATIGASQVPESLGRTPGSLVSPSGRHVRKGKIARLPKLERDMVNRMLQNNVPQDRIVAALDDLGIRVTLRNISNWKTRGG